MAAKAFIHQGQSYDLSHLDEQSFPVEIELKNKQTKTLNLICRFSVHCYTRKPDEAEVFDRSLVVMDHKAERLFDVRRWALSKRLPTLVAALPDHKVHKTPFHNMVHIAIESENGQSICYQVFFTLKKEGKKSILMVVESAYPVDELQGEKKKYNRPMRFLVAVTKAYEGSL